MSNPKIPVKMKYEIRNRMGNSMRSYWKEIDMPSAPYRGLVIEVTPDNPVEIERSIQYNPMDTSYFVYFVDNVDEAFYDQDDMFESNGWYRS